MAEEIAYKVSVDTGSGGKSLKDLKNDFKAAQSELSGLEQGTKAYVAQLAKLGAIRDDIGDLNAEINAFNPEGKVKAFGNVIGGLASGFQAATGAATLFGGSSKEIEKQLLKVQAVMAFTEGIKGLAGLGDSFKNLGNIIKLNPLMLIGTVIVGIGTALFALKDKIGIVGEAFDAIGKAISWVYDKVTAFTDAIGLTSVAFDNANNSIIENTKKATEAINSRYDGEIAAAKRSHKETVYLEIEKSKAILESNKLAIDAINRRRLANGTLNEEDAKALQELQKSNSDAYRNISDSWAAHKDTMAAADLKATEDYKKQQADRIKASGEAWLKEEALKEQAIANDELRQQQASDAEALRVQTSGEEWLAEDAAKQARIDADEQAQIESSDRIAAAKEANAQKEKDTINGNLQLAQTSTQGLMALNDLYFTVKRKNLVKGSAEDLAAAKKQFEINKKLSLVSATIMGIQSVIAAYQSGAAVPVAGVVLGPAMAILAGITAAANIAKIAGSQFEGGAPNVAGGVGGGGSVPNINAPSISSPQSGSTRLDASGNVIPSEQSRTPMIKAQVVETEITGTQKRVSSIETNAKI